MSINYIGGAQRIWLVLVALQVLLLGGVLLLIWNDAGFSTGLSVSEFHSAILGSAVGALLCSIGLKQEFLKSGNGGKFQSVLICLLPIASAIAFCCHLAGVLAVSGGWSPGFRSVFAGFFPAAIATALGACVVLIAPLLPFGLLGWVINGFSSK